MFESPPMTAYKIYLFYKFISGYYDVHHNRWGRWSKPPGNKKKSYS
jgi:hypothetical protein